MGQQGKDVVGGRPDSKMLKVVMGGTASSADTLTPGTSSSFPVLVLCCPQRRFRIQGFVFSYSFGFVDLLIDCWGPSAEGVLSLPMGSKVLPSYWLCPALSWSRTLKTHSQLESLQRSLLFPRLSFRTNGTSRASRATRSSRGTWREGITWPSRQKRASRSSR